MSLNASHRKKPDKWEIILITLLGVSGVILALVHLTTYPAPWFDEGWYLQIARNLAHYGQYAVLSSEGFRYDDTALAVAPTLYLPIALVFRLAGVGLLQARLVMVLYLLATVAAFYRTARTLHGYPVAAAATYLFLLRMEDDPFTSTVYLGRQAMGEVPALFFFLLGALLWFRALNTTRRTPLFISGLCFGLAMVTKLQYVFFIPPALLLTAMIAHQLRRPIWRPSLVTLTVGLVVLLAWYGILGALVGPQNLKAIIQGIQTASSPQVRVLSLTTLARSVKFLIRSDFLVFGLPALLYGLVLALRRDRRDVPALLLGAFMLTVMVWYVFASIGWPRYAYPFLAIGNLFIARLLCDLGNGFRLHFRSPTFVRTLAVLLILILLPLAQFRLVGRDILAPPDSGFEAFTRYIRTNVPLGRTIETWEWEVTFADEARYYHLPPTPLLNTLIAHVNLGLPYSPEEYNFQQFGPDYLIVGRFARWTGLYPVEFLENHCRHIVTTGEYELFEVIAQ